MFAQSKQLAVALVVSTALTSVGLGLLVSAITCDCDHKPECAEAASRTEAQERLASAEPWGQMPPDVIELLPDTREAEVLTRPVIKRRSETIRRQREMLRRIVREQTTDHSWGWDLMDVSDIDLRSPRKHAESAPGKVVPQRARRKQEITDPWAD